MAYKIISEIFADRELRLVRVPVSSGRKKTTPPSADLESGVGEVNPSAPQYGAGGSWLSSPGPGEIPLDSTLEFAHCAQIPILNRVYSRKARESLRRTGVAGEMSFPEKENWWFLTLTYPTESPEGMAAIAENSGYVVKQLGNWLRQFEDEESTFFYCWERQRRGTLHLHYAVYLPLARSRGFSNERFHDWAVRHVHNLSARGGCNLWLNKWGRDWSTSPKNLQSYAQKIEKSVSRYLAKYVSKEATKNSVSHATSPSPRRWWGRSRNLKRLTDGLTNRCEKECSSYLESVQVYSRLRAGLRLRFVHADVYESKSALADCDCLSVFKVMPCRVLRNFWNRLQIDFTKLFAGVKENMSSEFVLSIQDLQLLKDYAMLATGLDRRESPFAKFYSALEESSSWEDYAVWNYRLAVSKMTQTLTEALVDWQLLRLRSTSTQKQAEAMWLARFSACLRHCNLRRKVALLAALRSMVLDSQTSMNPDTWTQGYLDI